MGCGGVERRQQGERKKGRKKKRERKMEGGKEEKILKGNMGMKKRKQKELETELKLQVSSSIGMFKMVLSPKFPSSQ